MNNPDWVIDVSTMTLVIETAPSNKRNSNKFILGEIVKLLQRVDNANVGLIVWDQNGDQQLFLTTKDPSEKMKQVMELESTSDESTDPAPDWGKPEGEAV